MRPVNKGRSISTGLWSRSRHPNYFGEVVLWTGVLVIAVPVLEGWQRLALLSPVFVALLLIKGSGIPLPRLCENVRVPSSGCPGWVPCPHAEDID